MFYNPTGQPAAPATPGSGMPPPTGGEPDSTQCHPKFMRLTVNAIPNSTATKTKAALPLGAIIQPLARCEEQPVPVVNYGQGGVVRCRRCRTYINPFVTFADNGRRW